MAWLAFFLSLLSILIVGVLYWRIRKKQEASVENFSNQISGLLSEFNSVTSSKVELLDDRTDELRRVVDMAEMKIDQLQDLIERVDAIRETLAVAEQSDEAGNEDRLLREKVVELSRDGLSVTEIAEKTDLSPGEISVILKVNEKASLQE
ncbi:MAG: hypothetical protein ABEK50_07995 [bacterium]